MSIQKQVGRNRSWRSRPTAALSALFLSCGAGGEALSATLRVPQDYAAIQTAINAAQTGDTVLVSRGTYSGNLVITGKAITLASRHLLTGDPQDILQTRLTAGAPMLSIRASAGLSTTVQGLTFQDGDYQLVNYARRVSILHNRFVGGTGDQLSFENAGGLVRDCVFVNAHDDAIDSDGQSDPIIENNMIIGAGDDGMELRMQGFTGSILEIAIRGNFFTGCSKDGLQLIDYAGATNRVFRIEGNVFANNGMAGLGCMADGATSENFEGAPMVERVEVVGNTFVGNSHGLTGGDHMLVMNNDFVGAAQIGMKRVAGYSLASHNNFWNNGTDHVTSNVVAGTTFHQDPLLGPDFALQPGSPCIDAGTPSILWNKSPVFASDYLGAAPDLGAREIPTGPTLSVDPGSRSAGLRIADMRPNPTSHRFAVSFTLPDDSPARIEVLDVLGRRIESRELAGLGQGSHVVNIPESGRLSPGVYLVRVSHGRRSVTTRGIVVK